MALKNCLLILATSLPILVQTLQPIDEPGLAPALIATPVVPGRTLVPRLDHDQVNPNFAPSVPLRRWAIFKYVPGFSSRERAPRVSPRATTICYYPDGSVARDFNYTADPSVTSGYATCCDRTLGDEFLPGGLCFFPSSPQHGPYIYRAACTDRTFKSDRCAQVCRWNTPNRWESLIFCSQNSTFCCQASADEGSCCDDPTLAVKVPKFPDSVMSTISSVAAEETAGLSTETSSLGSSPTTPPSTPAFTTALTTPTPTTFTTSFIRSNTPIQTPTPTHTPTSANGTSESPNPTTPVDSKNELTTENIISLVLGLALGLPTLLATVYMCFHPPQRVVQGVQEYIIQPVAGLWRHGGEAGGRHELPGTPT